MSKRQIIQRLGIVFSIALLFSHSYLHNPLTNYHKFVKYRYILTQRRIDTSHVTVTRTAISKLKPISGLEHFSHSPRLSMPALYVNQNSLISDQTVVYGHKKRRLASNKVSMQEMVPHRKPTKQLKQSNRQSIVVDKMLSNTTAVNVTSISEPMSLKFVVFGEPIPLARHRMTRFGRMFNPMASHQKIFLSECSSLLPKAPWEGPLRVNATFFFSRPLSHFRTGKFSHMLKDSVDKWHIKRKDLDNLLKFVMDALNGKAYVDDSQICIIESAKLYCSDKPRTEVVISKIVDL